MGRGSSKAGGNAKVTSSNKAILSSDIVPSNDLAREFNSSKTTQDAAQALYDNPATMAFPSTANVVKRVPALQTMKQSMDGAPVGTTVVGRFGNGDVRVMEKTSNTGWSVTDLKPDSAGNGMYNGMKPGKYSGIKAMQQMQHLLNDSVSTGIPHGASVSYKDRR